MSTNPQAPWQEGKFFPPGTGLLSLCVDLFDVLVFKAEKLDVRGNRIFPPIGYLAGIFAASCGSRGIPRKVRPTIKNSCRRRVISITTRGWGGSKGARRRPSAATRIQPARPSNRTVVNAQQILPPALLTYVLNAKRPRRAAGCSLVCKGERPLLLLLDHIANVFALAARCCPLLLRQ